MNPKENMPWNLQGFSYQETHCRVISKFLAGWWYTYPSEKYEFVNWDDYSQYMEKHVPNHQPVGDSTT